MTDESRLFEHPVPEGNPEPKVTCCRVCGQEVGNYYAARVQHGRVHVKMGEAVEVKTDEGVIIFGIVAG